MAPTAIVAIMATYGWRESFYVCAAISFAWVLLWAATFTETPAAHPRIAPEELATLPSAKKTGAPVPWGPLFRRMAPVTIVYFCYGWTLWLFLTWIPQYFLHSYELSLTKSALYASTVFLAGVLGDTLGGVVTDRIYTLTGSLAKARSWMVAICMMATLLSLIPMMFTHDLYVSLACLASGFFFAEMTIGPMWAIPMDIAPAFSGTASGMMNSGSALAAIISPVVGGWLIDRFGSWELPFLGSIVLMACGVALAFRMRPDAPFEAGAWRVDPLVVTPDAPVAPVRA